MDNQRVFSELRDSASSCALWLDELIGRQPIKGETVVSIVSFQVVPTYTSDEYVVIAVVNTRAVASLRRQGG